MTGEDARHLKVADYVRWNGAAGEMGVIVDVSRFGVVIRWADGRETTPFFNDMKRISHIDVSGRIVKP